MSLTLRYIPPVKEFEFNLDTRHLGSKKFQILSDIHFTLSNGDKIIIPRGMITDFSSSPRSIWSVFPPYGDFAPAAVVHDFLYISDYKIEEWGCKKARLFADREMLLISNRINKNKFDNYMRYLAVRLFGHKVWKK